MHVQVRDDDVRGVEACWWHMAPLPDNAQRMTIEFRDVTQVPRCPSGFKCARVYALLPYWSL